VGGSVSYSLVGYLMEISYGEAMTKANRKPVLSQLMALSDTWKNWEAVLDTAEKVNHCRLSAQSRWTMRQGLITYIPTNDDIEQDEYSKAKETSFVDFVVSSGVHKTSLRFNGLQVKNSGGGFWVQGSHFGVFILR
jgi:hypothetical protein